MAIKSKYDIIDLVSPGGYGSGYWECYWPDDLLAESSHWMILRCVQREFLPGADKPTKKDLGRIFLPLPVNFGVQYNQDYTSEGLGIGALLGQAAAQGATNAQSVIDNIVSSAGKLDSKDFKDFAQYAGSAAVEQAAPAIGASLGGATGAVAGVIAQGALKGAMGTLGVVRNPYMAVMYNNPQFREFQFSWKLVAKSYKEAQMISRMIRKLKYHAAPSIPSQNAHFFKYPDQWDIDHSEASTTFEIGPSVLKNISVNYHAEGQPIYFRDPSYTGDRADLSQDKTYPASVQLDLTFQEVFIVSREQIGTEEGLGDNR